MTDSPAVNESVNSRALTGSERTCTHCDAKVDHFHPGGGGVIFNERGVGFAIGSYHLTTCGDHLTDHDDDLPGQEYRGQTDWDRLLYTPE